MCFKREVNKMNYSKNKNILNNLMLKYDLSKEERKEFFKIIYSMGGMLTSVEASETPTRSYIVDISEQDRNALLNKKADERIMSDVMDAVLDEIIK